VTTLRTPEPAEAVQRLMTAEEFAQLPDDGRRLELVNGVVVEMSRPKPRHGRVAALLITKVGSFVEENNLGVVFSESGFVIGRDPDNIRGPDLAFVAASRAPADAALDKYLEGAPDLAVEIVSPNDKAEDVRGLIDEYFAAGARLVWIVYPGFKTIEVHHASGTADLRRTTDTLDGEDVLPGFSLPVAALFE
jgi:Uma2 family endonuclease